MAVCGCSVTDKLSVNMCPALTSMLKFFYNNQASTVSDNKSVSIHIVGP